MAETIRRMYVCDKTKKAVEADWLSRHKRKTDLPVTEADNAIVVPLIPAVNSLGRPDRGTGVLDEHGNFIEGSGMRRNLVQNIELPPDIPYVDTVAIWGGLLIPHYGHFLMQSTARLYYYIKNKEKNLPVVFVCPEKKLQKFMAEFFSLMGLSEDKIILVDNYTRFKKVICPPLSSEFYEDYNDNFVLPFRTCADNVAPAPYEKVYLTRRRWQGAAKCLGEEKIEKLFNKNGYKSVALETLSLKKQIAVVKGAHEMAGIIGTAFHNALFAHPGQKLIILNRSHNNNCQYIVNEAIQADWYLIDIGVSPLAVTHSYGPFIVSKTDYLKDFLKDHQMHDFGIKFYPEQYLKKFFDCYCCNYSQPYMMESLLFDLKGSTTDEFQKVLCLYGRIWPRFCYKKALFYLLSKLTFGNLRKRFKKEYETYCQKILSA